MTKDLTPFMYGLTPDATAQDEARIFAALYSHTGRIDSRLEDMLMCFTSFVADHQGRAAPSAGHSEVLNVLTYAASGLYALLESGQLGAWETLSLARMWAVDKFQKATDGKGFAQVEALQEALRTGYTLPEWAEAQGPSAEADLLAGWYAVSYLLECLPHLEDGEAEDAIDMLLEAFTAGPWPIARALHLAASLTTLTDEEGDTPSTAPDMQA